MSDLDNFSDLLNHLINKQQTTIKTMFASSTSSTNSLHANKTRASLDYLNTKRQELEAKNKKTAQDPVYEAKILKAEPSSYLQLFLEANDHGKLLYSAISHRKYDLVSYIITNKPTILDKDNLNDIFILVTLDGDKTIDFVKPLLELNVTLPQVLEISLQSAIIFKKPDLVKWLIAKGADINWGFSAVMISAASIGDLETARMFVARGIKLDAQNIVQMLTSAAMIGATDFIDLCYHLSTSPCFGGIPIITQQVLDAVLTVASMYRRIPFVKVILSKGAKDVNNLNFLSSCRLGYHDLAEVFIAHGANVTVSNNLGLTYAIASSDVKLIELLIKHGSDEKLLQTAVASQAAKSGDIATLITLLGSTASTPTSEESSKSSPKSSGPTPPFPPTAEQKTKLAIFYEACMSGNLKVVQLLASNFDLPVLKHGFQYASSKSHYELVQYLITLISKSTASSSTSSTL